MPTNPERPSRAQNVSDDTNIVIGGDVNGVVIAGDNNTVNQTIIQKIFNIFRSDSETTEQRNRRIMLGHVENFWVKGILEKSLYGTALLELGIKEDPEALNYPWAIKRKANEETLSTGTSMLKIFQEIGLGRSLLILGAPGSGKTTMLLELTRQLIQHARQDVTEPIPVVFNLSSWTEKITLADWLARELNVIYTIPKKIAPSWVTENKMMLLLDGLDEVKQESRDKCVDAINQFKKENGLTSIAVCSRIQDYAGLKTRLAFDGAIEIQPLTSNQVDEYFDRFGDGLAGIRQILEKDSVLREMAETPLFLSIMMLAYRNTPTIDVLVSTDVNKQHKYLFDTYIERMFERPRSKNALIKKQDVLHWLSWLAQKMVEYNAVPYLLENMQPEWLETKQAWWYQRIQEASIALSFGLLGLLIYGVIGSLIGLILLPSILLIVLPIIRLISNLITWLSSVIRNWLILGAILGATLGVIEVMIIMLASLASGDFNLNDILLLLLIFEPFYGLIGGLVGWLYSRRGSRKLETSQTLWDPNIKMVEALQFNWNKSGKESIFVAIVFTMIFSLLGGLFFGLGMGLSVGLFSGLISGLEIRPIDQTNYPGQKIVSSLKNYFFILMIIGSIGGLIIMLLGRFIGNLTVGLSFTLIGVLIFGLLFGLRFGGSAVFKHYSLRLICFIAHLLPWRLVPFLDYCVDLIFLRRVGGGYIFVHRLLMEHFAAMYREGEKELLSDA